MPLTFPSHQGLILPLARRWPDRFEPVALCIGAAMPDVVDGVIGIGTGYLGRGLGHSLVGLFLLSLPGGLLLTWLTITVWNRIAGTAPTLRRLRAAIEKLWPRREDPAGSGAGRLVTACLSVCLGAFSHLFFDFISHGGFKWLYPWYPDIDCFPGWWHTEWFGIDFPWYREPYPFAPHTVVWCVLSIIGAWLFLRPMLRKPNNHSGPRTPR